MDESEIPRPVVPLGLSVTSGWEQTPRAMHHRGSAHRVESQTGSRVCRAVASDKYASRLFDDPEYLWPRKSRAAEEEPVAVILRDVPPPMNWGWFSREDQRMHLQTVNKENQAPNQYKAWLEDRASWAITWEKKPPNAKDAKAVEKAIDGQRTQIQALWAAFMIEKNWLTAHLSGQTVVVVAYPQTAGKFERTIDLSRELPMMSTYPTPNDIGLDAENASVVVWKNRPEPRQHHFPLAGFLWK